MANIPGPVPMSWISCSEIGITTQQPSIHFNNLIYAQIGVTPAYGPPMDTWTTVDCRPWGVPECAKGLFVSGIIGCTGSASEESGLKVYLRQHGNAAAIDPPDNSYIGQSNCGISDGDRSNFSAWVALSDCKFDWAWNRATTGNWPDHPSYLINVGPQAWVR